MLTKEPRWAQLTPELQEELSLEKAMSCVLAKIFAFSEGRNAYWGNWAINDFGLSPDLRALGDKVQRWRKQGSQFTIYEIPAVCVLAQSVSVFLIADRWDCAPFKGAHEFKCTGVLLTEVARALEISLPSALAYVSDVSQFKAAVFPFNTQHSVPQGPGERLAWKTKRTDLDLQHILAMCVTVCMHLNNAGH
jgi:hypothetical protein